MVVAASGGGRYGFGFGLAWDTDLGRYFGLAVGSVSSWYYG